MFPDRTKPRLAQEMLERALEAGVPFAWVTGDRSTAATAACGCLEQKGMSHVLAIKSNEQLWVWTDQGPRQVRADRLAALVDASHFNGQRGRWRQGSQGLRLGQGGATAFRARLLTAGPAQRTKPGIIRRLWPPTTLDW